ncbi:MAG: DUF881 domain-containing protein [Actinomycetota bacterium]|nr:DUF881 domain-containing protein [Actinomycetota bacterium]
MRDAGAEAIELNDRVRVVAQTAFRDVPGGVHVDGTVLRPPYVVEVIGDPHTLREAMVFPGGVQDEVEQLQGTATVARRAAVRITSLHRYASPQYARPAS